MSCNLVSENLRICLPRVTHISNPPLLFSDICDILCVFSRGEEPIERRCDGSEFAMSSVVGLSLDCQPPKMTQRRIINNESLALA